MSNKQKFIVVRGYNRWSITTECAYAIFGAFASESTGKQLEQEMVDYTVDKLKNVDGYKTGNEVMIYHKDISVMGQPSVGTLECVIERDLGGVWYAFIAEESINALFDTV
jgi:hypothetical protein